MAELNTSDSGGHGKRSGIKKSKKLSTRIDLTPMVDLGFLLITFFMYTTTMAKPKTMEINMPYIDKDIKAKPTEIKVNAALTILLSKNHQVYYYEGIGNDPSNPPIVKTTSFNARNGIRETIIAKKRKVAAFQETGVLNADDEATILIKPDITSTYNDLVNILDEMSINDVRVYAIVNITPLDQEFIHIAEQRNRIK